MNKDLNIENKKSANLGGFFKDSYFKNNTRYFINKNKMTINVYIEIT